MIVGDLKPIEEIEASIRGCSRVLILGCRGCVTVCSTGGEKEVAVLASQLRIASQARGSNGRYARQPSNGSVISSTSNPLLPEIEDVDVVVSLACGAGVQHVAEASAGLERPVQVVPGINTTFLGAALEQGVWAERCQGCGDCVLEITGGICPIARCSKSLLNGPCGGSSGGKCEIDPDVDCGWQLIYDRLSALGKLENMTPRAADPRLVHEPGRRSAQARRGGAEKMKSDSKLERLLQAGEFVVTGECGPPKGADVDKVRQKAEFLIGHVDAVNVTDNQTAIVRMSSIGASAILVQMGLEPVMQMVCRDRNRIAMQSDIFGAYALGIRNMLCLSGDHQKFGNHAGAKNVYDVDSIQLIDMVRRMRDEGKVDSGDEIDGVPRMFIGAAANPFGDPFAFRVIRLAKKIAAGVDFIQTQCIYNMDKFKTWMRQVVDQGLDREGAHPGRRHAAEVAGHGPLHGQERVRHRGARRRDQADQGRPQGEAGRGGHQDLHRADPAAARDPRGSRHPPDGHRVGAQGPRDRQGRRPVPTSRLARAEAILRTLHRPARHRGKTAERIGINNRGTSGR